MNLKSQEDEIPKLNLDLLFHQDPQIRLFLCGFALFVFIMIFIATILSPILYFALFLLSP